MNRSFNHLAVAAVGFILIFSGCSSGPSDDTASPAPSPTLTPVAPSDLHGQYNADVAAFADIDYEQDSVTAYDALNDHLFTKIFGGTNSASVLKYYQDRIQYAFTQSELEQAPINVHLSQEGWLSDPNGKDAPAGAVGALNVSTLLWLMGEVAGQPIAFTVDGQNISIDSTRPGLIEFGEGYAIAYADDEQYIPLPTEYRQAILVHEARHSDCTDGLSKEELAIMKSATSTEDLRQKVPLPHCGHLHIICPSGTYEGIAACDAEKYGAYAVGAVYEAALIDAQADDVARTILQASAADYFSRYVSTDPDAPDEQSPNMTSEGLVP